MTRRRVLGCVLVAVLGVCAWAGCGKDKGEKGKTEASSADIGTRCEQLGKACGDNEKHVQTIVAECKEAAKEQVVSGCAEKAVAAYDCYEKNLCGGADKVWALEDLRVLSERHGKCEVERDASRACVAK